MEKWRNEILKNINSYNTRVSLNKIITRIFKYVKLPQESIISISVANNFYFVKYRIPSFIKESLTIIYLSSCDTKLMEHRSC